ncbi:MAG: hypothetical protein U5K81_09785 [Trueperaceae bacterium]|nr:hypothetical protein [Trueperaceae bacterium]
MARCVAVMVGWSLFAVASGCAGGATQDGTAAALNVAPTDLTTGPGGSLFVSSASAGKVLRQVDGMWRDVPGPWARPYGLTAASDGRVCLAHFTSEDPLTRQSAVSCRDAGAWTREATGLGSGVNGLLATAEGIWAVGWQDTDIEQRDGRLSLIADGRITRRIDIPAYVPRFAVETPTGDLLVSAWREDASGFTGGAILRVTREGSVDMFSDALTRPAGLAYGHDGVWVADTAAGALVLLSHDGRESARQKGLEEPTGVTLVEADRLCLAETAAHRITCLVPANVLGGSP